MIKKLAAFGLTAALALSPVAALAQAETTPPPGGAPAAPGGAPAPGGALWRLRLWFTTIIITIITWCTTTTTWR